MNKVLLAYWPQQGNVEQVAGKISEKLNNLTVVAKTIDTVTSQDLQDADNWIIGGSTVGSHVWMDADDTNRWNDFFKLLDTVDLKSKVVAFYGLGDQILYPHHFVDGLGIFQEEFEKRNANIVGRWPIEGYSFYDSEGMIDKKFYGLALDEDQEPEHTDTRLEKWLEQIKPDFK